MEWIESGYETKIRWIESHMGCTATAQTQHQVQRRLLLDVVVGQSAAVLKLLAREDQPLLVRRDALLVLDLRLHVLDRVAALDLESATWDTHVCVPRGNERHATRNRFKTVSGGVLTQ